MYVHACNLLCVVTCYVWWHIVRNSFIIRTCLLSIIVSFWKCLNQNIVTVYVDWEYFSVK